MKYQSNPLLEENNRFDKRASFMPSRGKKEQLDQFYEVDSPEKKASAGFLPMRGRKDYYDQPIAQGWYVNEQGDTEDKRAGFMPMRGRKNWPYFTDNGLSSADDVLTSELAAMKRMSSFMPMRGRKDDKNTEQNMNPQFIQSLESIGRPNWMEGEHSSAGTGSYGGQELVKKANSFFGARGKRSVANNAVNHLVPISANKRVGLLSEKSDNYHNYNENFFATRG